MIIRTGIQSIDKFCGGLRGGTLTILTGTVGCAATSFALTLAHGIAESDNVLFLSRIYKQPEGLHDGIFFDCTEYFSNNSINVPEKSPILTRIIHQITENNAHALFIVQSTQKTAFLSLAEELTTDKMNQSEKLHLIVTTFRAVAEEYDIPVLVFWEISHVERRDAELAECLRFGQDRQPQPDYVHELECLSRNKTDRTSAERITMTNTSNNFSAAADFLFHFDTGTWEKISHADIS